MKLHATLPRGVNTITGYGEGYVMVNGERRDSSVVVLPDRIEEWPVKGFDQLSADHFAFLKNLQMEIVLLGTGTAMVYPTLLAVIALAFVWCCLVGEFEQQRDPSRCLRHGYPPKSLFRRGLDALRAVLTKPNRGAGPAFPDFLATFDP